VELRSFIKLFTWEESDRSRVVLGPNTRLNPDTNRAQLGSYDSAIYPTDADLYVKSWVANPGEVREWQGFEATILHKTANGVQVTGEGFRLSDGTNEYWWNGASWAIDVANWNTEAEVAANISSFPVVARKLQVVVNLSTTDETQTPELVEIKVLFGALLDSELEDLLIRSLVPAIRAGVRPVMRFVLTATGTDQIDMKQFKLDGDYRVVDVDAVFNHSDDSSHEADLYLSHTVRSDPTDSWVNGQVDTITLSASVSVGNTLLLRLKYEPVVAIETSRDYYEIEHVPCVVFERISYVAREHGGEHYVGNKASHTAKVLKSPLQGTLEMTIVGMSGKLVDHERLDAEVSRFFGSNRVIRSTALDESYRLRLISEHEHRSRPNAADLRTWTKIIQVENFRTWHRAVEDGYLVTRFLVTGDVSATVE